MTRSGGVAGAYEWWSLLACGLIAGTFGHLLIGWLFRLLVMQVILAASPPGPDSPAMYATWPMFASFIASTLAPVELSYGAVGGVGIALVLRHARNGRLPAWLYSGVLFAAIMVVRELSAAPQPLSVALGIVGNVLRGATLAWLADWMHKRWQER